MSIKILRFDATEVVTKVRSKSCLTVEVETHYLDEVLNEFTEEEIIENYSNLETLYEQLKEYFGDEDGDEDEDEDGE